MFKNAINTYKKNSKNINVYLFIYLFVLTFISNIQIHEMDFTAVAGTDGHLK